MSTLTNTLARLSTYDAYRWARDLFDHRDYYTAARVLQHLVDSHPEDARSGLGEVRELLARAYYHSAQIVPATAAARELLDHEPTNAYAALLLARSLERRSEDASAARRLATALGAPGTAAA